MNITETTTSEVSLVTTSKLKSVKAVLTGNGGAAITSSVENLSKVGDEVLSSEIITTRFQVSPDDTIEMVDPETGEPNGSSYTVSELHVMLFSLNKHVVDSKKQADEERERSLADYSGE